MHGSHLLLGLCLSAAAVVAAPSAEQATVKRAKPKYPFDHMIAFGDNLSDNGNGSYAHCVQGGPTQCNNTIYGFRTWTNGPVAVSYLSTLLGVPLTVDYAFGEADGGSRIGATINNSYTASLYAPDAFTQVANYTKTKGLTKAEIGKALHFLWIGNNDISLKHISTTSPVNLDFATQMSGMMVELVRRLVNAGANYIFVPAIYPKHLAPFAKYLASNPTEVKNLGLAIQQANTAIRAALLLNFGKRVVYYDAFKFLVDVNKNHPSYGITHIQPTYCDGYSQAFYEQCLIQKQGQLFYWTQQTDFTTRVASLLAADMNTAIQKAFA